MLDEYDTLLSVIADNVGLEPHEEHYGYPGTLLDLRVAAFRPGTTQLDRADAVRDVLLARERDYRERVAEWADPLFAAAVSGVPLRLPIDQHRAVVRVLKARWYEPLKALYGVEQAYAWTRRYDPQRPQWHRYKLFDNRSYKSRSKKRKAWLKANGRSEAQIRAEAVYYTKRKATRAAARAAKAVAS